MLPDEEGTKVNRCVENILQCWRDGDSQKLTQLVFCDISTPKAAPSVQKKWGPRRNPAERLRWGEEGQRSGMKFSAPAGDGVERISPRRGPGQSGASGRPPAPGLISQKLKRQRIRTARGPGKRPAPCFDASYILPETRCNHAHKN